MPQVILNPRVKPPTPLSTSPQALQTLKERITPALSKWASIKQSANAGYPPGHYALGKCTASIELLADVLDQISSKKGARADALRRELESERDRIASAVAAFEGFRADFSGPEAQRLSGEILRVQELSAAADYAYATATAETLEGALLAKERARIEARDLDAELARAEHSLQVPHGLPSAESFDRARADTEMLEGLPTPLSTRDTVAAIAAGKAGDSSLWVLYERNESHPALVLARAAAAEARG